MFDKQKMKELQQRSHNRGLLSKEFYSTQQQQLDRKRRQMKAELDRQVQERRRQKELQKLQNQRRIKKQEEQIKSYYKHLQNRDKRTSANQSSGLYASNMKQATQPYQTYPVENQSQSRHKGISLNKSKGGQSRPNLINEGDIPLLPVMPNQYGQPIFKDSHQQQTSVLSMSKQSVQNIGNIPLLSLGQDNNLIANKIKKSKQKTTKRQKTFETVKESQEKIQQSRQVTNPIAINPKEQRRSTIPDQQSIFGSIAHANNSVQKHGQNYQIPQQLIEYEQENKSLKIQLKKKQQALSLLMGAVRSNGKLDKYRAQAQRILYKGHDQSAVKKEDVKQQQKGLMLPKISIRNQSIMHDYLISLAHRNKKSQA